MVNDDANVYYSEPFRLMAWDTYPRRWDTSASVDSHLWRPAYPPDAKVWPQDLMGPLRSRWVYVYVISGAYPRAQGKNAVAAQIELFVDAAGAISMTPLDAKTGPVFAEPEPKPLAPDFAGPQKDLLRVPYAMRGLCDKEKAVPLSYCLYASSARLRPEQSKRLTEWAAHRLVPLYPVEYTASDRPHPQDVGQRLHRKDGVLCAGVVDAPRMGQHMNRAYLSMRDSLVGYTTTYEKQDPAEQKRALERNKKKMLAEALKAVLDGDKANTLKLRDHLAEDGKSVENFLANDETRVRDLARWTNEVAGDLCLWLESAMYLVWQEAVADRKEQHQLIESYAQCVGRLWESIPGQALMAKHLLDPKHFVNTYVIPQGPTTDDQLKTSQKVAPAVLNLWTEYAQVHLKLARTPEVLVAALNKISGETLVAIEVVKGFAQPVVKGSGFKAFPAIDYKLIVVAPGSAPAGWAKFIKGEAVEPLVQRFILSLELVNLYIAVKTVKKVDAELANLKDIAGVVGSLCTTTSAFLTIARPSAKKAIKFASGVGAVLDIATSAYDANEMAKRNDYSALAGNGIAAIGGALTAAGCFCAVAGVGTGSTIIGLPVAVALEIAGGILAAVGALVVICTTDTDMQTLAAHTVFGGEYGNGSAEPAWANGKLSAWKDDHDKQMSGLMNLIAGFTLEAKPEQDRVKVYYGLTRPTSQLSLHFHIEHSAGFDGTGPDKKPIDRTFFPKVRIDLEKKTVVAEGDPMDMSPARFVFGETGGQRWVDVTATHRPQDNKPSYNVRFNCWVRAQLMLDGTTSPIPGSGKRVEYQFRRRDQWLPPDPTHSKDT